jgi:predicted short-subunit dehydrogenase-like oxidoreductase (DUF2520 family)
MVKLGFIGAGTVGTALAVRLAEKGYPVVAVASRTFASAERLAALVLAVQVRAQVPGCRAVKTGQGVADAAELVFITTPDDAIGNVASGIRWHPGKAVVHCSGAHSTDILSEAKAQGALTGAFHPLQTFASVKYAIQNMPGSTFGIEAEEPLLATLKELAFALDGTPQVLRPDDKVLYHVSAVIASNYLVTLVKLATDLWMDFGATREEAIKALMPLIRGTLNNIQNVGIPNCLTGPIARGDAGTIEKHFEAIKTSAPSIFPIYCELGLNTIPISLAKGKIDAGQAAVLEEILREALKTVNVPERR